MSFQPITYWFDKQKLGKDIFLAPTFQGLNQAAPLHQSHTVIKIVP